MKGQSRDQAKGHRALAGFQAERRSSGSPSSPSLVAVTAPGILSHVLSVDASPSPGLLEPSM